jgi:sugar lactone lactonase YvrE
MRAELLLDARAELGEGPLWDAARGRLLWVDITAGAVHDTDPVTLDDDVTTIGQEVGAVLLRRPGGLLLPARDGFLALDEGATEPRLAVAVDPDDPILRLNDAACDGSGRCFAGTYHMEDVPQQAAFYRLDPDWSLHHLFDEVGCSNGIGWSPDDTRMYYVDSRRPEISVFDYDPATGTIEGRRPLASTPAEWGEPDGLVVDAEGGIWVAFWGGWAARRFTPEGALDAVVDLPVSRVTKCAFGGPNLETMFITSARGEVDDADQPHAGSLFVVEPGVRGMLPHPFGA